ncbi:metallophosphoesterase [Soonwooa sp.]|uniref:metallophosphoesterase n=1 Tax=Soonwooa sp. TaxID=1938592 RepID=UPI00289CACFB|nr:metallophosphoesterase [Soonwooa sp.]
MKFRYTIFAFLLLYSCANQSLQIRKDSIVQPTLFNKDAVHTFYLIGDAGNSNMAETQKPLIDLKQELSQASDSSTVLFLGDNIYPVGFDTASKEKEKLSQQKLDVQIDAVKNYRGKTIFVPGNHDWYSGLDGLKNQQKYVESQLGKKSFFPKAGSSIASISISHDIQLIVLDSQWYLANWDKYPNINNNSLINTRNIFFDELENEIKKAIGKTTIIAVHHPVFTNGPHGGRYSFKSNLFPAPIIGSVVNLIRKTSGISNQDLQNKRYNELIRRLVTLAQSNEKLIVVSGHEHSLQYLKQDNVPQIISGSGSKITPTKNVGSGIFSYGAPGFAKLEIMKDGSSNVSFISDRKTVFQTQVLPPDHKKNNNHFPPEIPKNYLSSV